MKESLEDLRNETQGISFKPLTYFPMITKDTFLEEYLNAFLKIKILENLQKTLWRYFFSKRMPKYLEELKFLEVSDIFIGIQNVQYLTAYKNSNQMVRN